MKYADSSYTSRKISLCLIKSRFGQCGRISSNDRENRSEKAVLSFIVNAKSLFTLPFNKQRVLASDVIIKVKTSMSFTIACGTGK